MHRMRLRDSAVVLGLMTGLVGACGLGMNGLEEDAADGGAVALTADATGGHEGGAGGSSSSSGGPAEVGAKDGATGATDATTSDGTTLSNDGTTDVLPAQPDSSSTPPDDAAADDASPPGEAQASDAGASEAAAPPCNTTDGCYVIPAGWQLVAFASNQTAACPNGFAAAKPTNLDEGPDASNACACGACAISAAPTCPAGPIQVNFDAKESVNAGTCASPQMPPQSDNSPAGGCDTDMNDGTTAPFYSDMDLSYTPPPSTGGQCASAGVATGDVTYSARDWGCLPDDPASAGCSGDECTLSLAAPYRVCVFQSGSEACPGAPFTDAHLVGTGTSLTCSACGCNVTAGCAGTMKLFMDMQCKQNELDIRADGQCRDPSAQNGAYSSYRYAPDLPANVTCQTTGASSAEDVVLQNETTVCCAP
jgi:hypothetical protein